MFRNRMPDPFLQPVYFDSCAFDGGDAAEQQASKEALQLFEDNDGIINILHSVQKEIDYPATPQWVRDRAADYVRTLEVPLTNREISELREVEKIINGNLEKRGADCRHVFEAQKYGLYFVTADRGILKHSDSIKKRFTTLYIVNPIKFLEIVKKHVGT